MRRLYLSTIDSKYRIDNDFVLGPWSFIGKEDIAPQWEDLTFPQAFETPEIVAETSVACSDLTCYLIAQWGEILNRRHGTTYETDFWRPLLTRWILHATSATWRRWNIVERFVEANRTETIRASVIDTTEKVSWNFSGLSEFINIGLISPEFDFWLYSLCLNRLAPDHWILEPINKFAVPSRENKKFTQPPVRTNALKRFGRQILGRLPFGDILGINPFWTLVFSAYVCVLPKHRPAQYYFQTIRKPPNSFPNSFLELLDHILRSSLLKCIDSDFHTYNEKAKRYRYFPGRLFVTGASHSNEDTNFQTAHAIVNGETVVRTQHGSSYGTMAHSHVKKLTEYSMSAFLTWGWTKQNNSKGRFFVGESPLLSRLRNRHRPRTNDIILVGTKIMLRSDRINYTPDPSYSTLYRKEKFLFVSSLDDSFFENLSYRPYVRSSLEMDDAAYMLKHFPTLKILNGSLEDAMLRCRLLVLDHPGTTLNIAMAANVPTICYWDPNTWPYSPEATPYFEALMKAKIIFPDGKSAARRINDLSDNIQDWWLSHEVQSARQAWADQYARTSRFWWLHWFKILSKI